MSALGPKAEVGETLLATVPAWSLCQLPAELDSTLIHLPNNCTTKYILQLWQRSENKA